MSHEIELEDVSSEREGQVSVYSRSTLNNNHCGCRIAAIFLTLLIAIILVFIDANKQMHRINQVEGSILQHLPIYSGELHYSRIPWQYWEHRILMVKAMGFNAVSIYVMWNFHEI